MKRIIGVLFGFGFLVTAQQVIGLGSTSYMQLEELTPHEAETLAYLWEEEKHLRDIFIQGTKCSTNPEVASAIIIEQDHMDFLKELLHFYGLEVPVPGEELGVFVSFEPAAWTGWGWVCVFSDQMASSDPIIFSQAIEYGELLIFDLIHAIDQTHRQRLLNAYDHLLVEACAQFRMHVQKYDPNMRPLFLSQELFDQIIAGTFPAPTNENFVINAGLNDAWYHPATDGQGFFISVFPVLGEVSLAWFTYDTFLPGEGAGADLGDSGQRWLIAKGHYAGSEAIMRVMSFSGGLFDTSPPQPEHEEVGSIVLKFEDCNTGSVTYDLPGIARFGLIPIERVAIDNVPVCEAYAQQPVFTE